jgi:hypothetical protein
MTEEERRQLASQATSTLGRNLAVGGFGNPATYNVPKFPEGQTASVRDWSQNPAVAAAIKTGNVSEIEKATTAARDAFRAGGTWADRAVQVPLNPTPALQQRAPEQQQDLLAQMRETGAGIRAGLDQESIQRGYAFRQGLAESAAQRALTPSFGNAVDKMGGAQAMIEAERWKQAQTGRNPMSREPLSFGEKGNQKTSSFSFERKNEPSIARGLMPAFDFGFSPVPSYTPSVMPSFGSIAYGLNPSPFNV